MKESGLSLEKKLNNINIIENYISQDTAEFLYKTVGPLTVETPDPGVWGGLSKNQNSDLLKLGNPISEYTEGKEYNIAVDILTMLSTSISKTISDHYGSKYFVRNIFYNKMLSGAKNKLHMDNYYLNSEEEVFYERPGLSKDKSALLYLNNPLEYDGGEICFPLQDLILKPLPGSLLFFEGNKSFPHEVMEIKNGERHNVVIFLTNEDSSLDSLDHIVNERPIELSDLKDISP